MPGAGAVHLIRSVNLIFQRYLDLGCVRALRSDLEAKGVVSKIWTSEKGRKHGGKPFDRGALYCLLKNRVYLGETTHKGSNYPGEHSAIVSRELFEAVEGRLASRRRQRRSKLNAPGVHALTGLIFDHRGNAMTPTYSRKSNGNEYRYYVSSATLTGKRSVAGAIARVPAQTIEDIVNKTKRRLGLVGDEDDSGSRPHSHQPLLRLEIHTHSIAIHLDRNDALASWRANLSERAAITDLELIAGRIADLAPGETSQRASRRARSELADPRKIPWGTDPHLDSRQPCRRSRGARASRANQSPRTCARLERDVGTWRRDVS